jgi:WhiB family transcriptional regulator, redox-sensing transcriptional regulator
MPATDWMASGLCAQTDPDEFYPDRGGSARQAKAVCARCPVITECLEDAIVHDERYGVWGGLSERERRPLRAAHKAAIVDRLVA